MVKLKCKIIPDFPVVTVGPDNPYRVELDQTAKMQCQVDSKPSTESVRWEYAGRFIDTNFQHIIPQVTVCSDNNIITPTLKSYTQHLDHVLRFIILNNNLQLPSQ